MNKTLYLFLFVSFTNIVTAQQFAVIRGTIVTDDSVHLEVFKPVNGYLNSVHYHSEQGPKILRTPL
jgi:5'(3')-deoxyribonucleotidase